MHAQRLLTAIPAILFSVAAGAAAVHAGALLDQGEATWYGPWHAGRPTTSGALFDPAKMTAAHHTLPLGSYVRVTDDSTGRSVVVQVNDREPPHGVRCIDLSEGAAQRLGMVHRGVAEVTITAADPSEATELAEAPDAPIARHGRPHRRHARR